VDVRRNSTGKEFHAVWAPQQKMNCLPNICMFVVQSSPDATRITVDRQNRVDRVRPYIAALYH